MTSPTDPSPADVVARLRPSWAADEAVSRAVATAGPEVREAVSTFLVENNRLKSAAAALITSLQARAEKAEWERDEWFQVARKFVVRTTRAEEALKLIRICEADGERFRFFVHATADVALANKETENG